MAGGKENLKPQAHKLTLAEQSAGGKASGIARAKKKTIKELAQMLGGLQVTNAKMLAIMRAAGIQEDSLTNDMAMLLGLQMKAQNGDPSAAKLLMELRQEYSTRVEVEPVQPKPLIDLTEGKK